MRYALLFLLLSWASADADSVLLKNGETIEGEVIEYLAGQHCKIMANGLIYGHRRAER